MADLSTAINQLIEVALSGLYCVLPGYVVKYEYRTCKASVQPAIKKTYLTTVEEELLPTEVKNLSQLPIIEDVPVLWPRTADFIIHAPLAKGDGVLLLFSDRSLEGFLNANSGRTVDAPDNRKHSLSDAIAIPGLYGFKNVNPSSGFNQVEIIYKDAAIVIEENGRVDINDGNLTVDV